MSVLSVREIPADELRGQNVLVRIEAVDEAKMLDSVPTLSYLSGVGARVSVITESSANCAPGVIAERLSEMLGRAVENVGSCRSEAARSATRAIGEGGIVVIGDLASEPGEKTNDHELAERLAALCDIYCNDAFALSHEVRASAVGVALRAPRAIAGISFARNLNMLRMALQRPHRPVVSVLGGELSKDKMHLAERVAARSEITLIAGQLCVPFLLAKGISPGRAVVSDEDLSIARSMLNRARDEKRDIVTPVDFIVAGSDTFDRLAGGSPFAMGPPLSIVDQDEVRHDRIICDIGEKTRWAWSDYFSFANTIFWHGPLGICELEPFASGTRFLAGKLAERAWPGTRRIVVCGRSIVESLRRGGVATERLRHLSAAGRASLHFMAGNSLPAVEALERRESVGKKRANVVALLTGSGEDVSVAEALAESVKGDAKIFLLHVRAGIDEELNPDLARSMTEAERFERRIESERAFTRANAIIASRGLVSADQISVSGDPREIALRYSKQLRADLIVASARDELVSSVIGNLVAQANCTVLAVSSGKRARRAAVTSS
ncbi:MAG TPA: phosphoglycerate kinase [Blastocatellia bacterium]|nr:phosphoglycerate kinase [Blastocatellia bacterium]